MRHWLKQALLIFVSGACAGAIIAVLLVFLGQLPNLDQGLPATPREWWSAVSGVVALGLLVAGFGAAFGLAAAVACAVPALLLMRLVGPQNYSRRLALPSGALMGAVVGIAMFISNGPPQPASGKGLVIALCVLGGIIAAELFLRLGRRTAAWS